MFKHKIQWAYLLCANACIVSTWSLPLHHEVSKPTPKWHWHWIWENDELESVQVWNFNSKITLENIYKKSHILTMFYYIFFFDATNCKIIHVLLFTDKF